MNNLVKYFKENLIFFIFLFVAFLLRIFNFFGTGYMNDDLSGLYRTLYPSYFEMLQFGVKEFEGHPPLLQTLLFYWSKLGSFHEYWMRIPFFLASMASLVLVYKLAKLIFKNETVSLLALALVSISQMHIIYTNFIRMYILGVFFALALVYCWYSFIHFKRHYVPMIVFAVLGFYTHYFLAVLVVLVYLTGWIWFEKLDVRKYSLSLAFVILGLLPGCSIFYYQLFKLDGGLTWLGTPKDRWLYDFIFQMAHENYIVLIILILSMLATFFMIKKSVLPMLFISWFLVIFLSAFYYSKHIMPVIQIHLFIFYMPFVWIAIAWVWVEILKEKKWVMVFSALFICFFSYGLVVKRKHFSIQNKHPFHSIMELCYEKGNPIKTLVVTDINHRYLNFYNQWKHKNATFISLSQKDTLTASFVENYERVLISTIEPIYSAPFLTGYNRVFFRNDQFTTIQILERKKVLKPTLTIEKDVTNEFEKGNRSVKFDHRMDKLYGFMLEFNNSIKPQDGHISIYLSSKEQIVSRSSGNLYLFPFQTEWKENFSIFCISNNEIEKYLGKEMSIQFNYIPTSDSLKVRKAYVISYPYNPYLYSSVSPILHHE